MADTCGGLTETDRLDPRPRAEAVAAPIAGAVNIPLSELPARVAELPPPGVSVHVTASGPLFDETRAALARLGRTAVPDEAPPPADPEATPPHVRPRLWRPSPLLTEIAPRLTAGQALDLGCGGGRDAVYLADRGWRVDAVDILPDALDIGRSLAARYLEDPARVRWIEADIEAAFRPPATYDLIVIVRYLPRPVLPKLAEWLTPSGSLVLETFTPEHRARHGRPNAAQVLAIDEAAAALHGLHIRHGVASDHGDAHLVRIWAERDPGAIS